MGSIFTPLRLGEAFMEYDEFFALSRRRYVPPNFAELRHVLNIAQVWILRISPAATCSNGIHTHLWMNLGFILKVEDLRCHIEGGLYVQPAYSQLNYTPNHHSI